MSHNLDLIIEKYSEKELEENIHLFDNIDWGDISWDQELSEDFIEKYKDKLNWSNVSYKQNISREFIQKHIDKLNIYYILENKNIPDEVKEEIKIMKEII